MNRVRPILFNTDMVRAILDGRKTVTRRIAKKIPVETHRVEPIQSFSNGKMEFECHWGGFQPDTGAFVDGACIVVPPYQPGDFLYVRETWTQECGRYYYRADYDSDYLEPCETLSGGYPSECRHYPGCEGCMRTGRYIRWRPSIHMPKEAARIWLKVTDVRVERLQDMKLDDFLPEGLTVRPEAFNDPENVYLQCRREFITIWNSTIKKSDLDRYGWEANPWVWVIEFERCEKPDGGNS